MERDCYMKILSITASNFGSYEYLQIDLEHKGLTLVSGPTGSGKSTICDLVPWALFGTTSKNGAVDEIRRWNAKDTTAVRVDIQLPDKYLVVCRLRKPNDLYYFFDADPNPKRGKDLADTQKLINDLLGIDSETYLSSSYYHEFSKVAGFFTSTPKYRRQMTEQLVDLNLAKKVAEATAKNLLTLKRDIATTQYEIDTLKSNKSRLLQDKADQVSRIENWQASHTAKLDRLVKQVEDFDNQETTRLTVKPKQTNKTCPTCGAPTKGHITHPIPERRTNPYLYALQEASKETLPMEDVLSSIVKNINLKTDQLKTEIDRLAELQQQYSDNLALNDIVSDFREMQIKNTIIGLQETTNRLLSSHFDAEIKVSFNLDGLDKLDVSLLKNEYICSYTQLSKGQRQLLKLCFGIAVMKHVSNFSGVRTNVAFLDEALEGLDEVLKVKAFSLLKELSLDYDALLVVDHSPGLKQMFTSSIEVSLVNGVSTIEET